MKKDFLDSINVKSPCDKVWDEMTGSNQVRFCSYCETNVHNISVMNRAEAEKLITKSNGKLCIRIEKNTSEKITIAPPKFTQIKRRATIAAGILATSLTLSALTYGQGEPLTPKENPSQTQNDKSQRKGQKQTLPTVSGVLKDSAEAALVSGAKVTLQNKETQQIYSTQTNVEGFYELKNVEPAIYEITFEAVGFQKMILDDVEIRLNVNLNNNLLLTNTAIVGLYSTEPTLEVVKEQPMMTIQQRPLLDLPPNPNRIFLGLIASPQDQKTNKKKKKN
jgi:Carboxypeptidase regulatory-like domain